MAPASGNASLALVHILYIVTLRSRDQPFLLWDLWYKVQALHRENHVTFLSKTSSHLPLEPSEGKCFGVTNSLTMPNFSAEVLSPREPQSWVYQDVGHPLWTQAWVLPGLVV